MQTQIMVLIMHANTDNDRNYARKQRIMIVIMHANKENGSNYACKQR